VALAAGVGLVLPSADRTAGDTWHSAGTEDPDRPARGTRGGRRPIALSGGTVTDYPFAFGFMAATLFALAGRHRATAAKS
jgi:hypothetical protein